jgi:hypothetical protein
MYPPLLSLKPQGYIWSQFTEIIWQFTKTPTNFLLKTSLSSPTTHLWRHRGERKYSSYPFSTSALDSGEWSVSRPGRALVPGRGPLVPTVQGAGWGPRAGLDTEATGKILSPLPWIEPRSPGHPAHSQTVCWLSYPAHNCFATHNL